MKPKENSFSVMECNVLLGSFEWFYETDKLTVTVGAKTIIITSATML
jgi:hypothetical protein